MTAQLELTDAVWRRSSHSGNGSDCVEVAFGATTVAVRDSKNPAGPALVFTRNDWSAFLSAARAGHLTG